MVESLMFGLIRSNSNILSLIEYVFAEKDKKNNMKKVIKKLTRLGPGLDCLTQARSGLMSAQPTLRLGMPWHG